MRKRLERAQHGPCHSRAVAVPRWHGGLPWANHTLGTRCALGGRTEGGTNAEDDQTSCFPEFCLQEKKRRG